MKYTGRFGTFTVRPDQVDYYAPKVKAQKKKRAQAARGLAEWLELYKTCLNGCGRPVAFYDTVHYALRYGGCCSRGCDAERQRKLQAGAGEAMTAPQRVQLSRAKGWRMPENTVKVDRTTPWGNPFVVGKDGTAARCVELFRFLLGGYVCMSKGDPTAQMGYVEHARAHRHELRGKNLACWCKPGTPCHADVLLELANQPKE